MKPSAPPGISTLRHRFSQLLSLREDKAEDAEIDQALRAGVEMRGTNLWVLMFAIFIASIGLNVNSTAVIIGAMLISPLMGPIMGIGYGMGVYDFQLVRTALKNLGVAVFISLATSVIYFLITPLSEAQSELLARTTPTIWDVLIALFGGLAGIVGATRKEKSNVIPGVAIATALMPPLCTAGYGIANGNWAYFGGAFYLFTINSVFIALSSAVVIRAFHVEKKHFVDERTSRRVKAYAMAAAVMTMIPSIYLAYQLVQDELFKSRAAHFIETELSGDKSYVTQLAIEPKSRTISITVIGAYLTTEQISALSSRLPAAGLTQAKLEVHQQTNQERIDISKLKTGLLSDLYAKNQLALENKDRQIQELREMLNKRHDLEEKLQQIPEELRAIAPQAVEIWLSQAIVWDAKSGMQTEPSILLNLKCNGPFSAADHLKIKNWLQARLQVKTVTLFVQFAPIPSAKPTKQRRRHARLGQGAAPA